MADRIQGLINFDLSFLRGENFRQIDHRKS